MAKKVHAIDPKLSGAVVSAAHHLSIVASGLTTQSKTYETWIAFEMAHELAKAGASVTALDHTNAIATVFHVRGGPGYMVPMSASGTDLPCYFQIQWEGKAVELHVSLVHRGIHANEHEIDVSVIDHNRAQFLRQQSHPMPFDGKWLVGAEMKAYLPSRTLDKSICRAAVGLLFDLHPLSVMPVMQFQSKTGHVLWSGQFHSPQYYLLTSAYLSSPSVKLLDTYGIKSAASVWPGTASMKAIWNGFVADVKQRL